MAPRRRARPSPGTPEPRSALAPRACGQAESDGVVQLAYARRLARGELVDERAREASLGELRERPLARVVLRRATEHLAEGASDEGRIGLLVGLQRGADERIHA